MQYKFNDSDVNLALEQFLYSCRNCFGDDLVSVVVYGSLVFDDLAPGYGDLDFLAVVKDDIPEEMYTVVSDLRKPLRSGNYGIIATMIEGEFVPRKALKATEIGQSYYWGTKSDKPRTGCGIHGIVARVILERGIVIYGEDIRCDIPRPSRDEIIAELQSYTKSVREHGRGGGIHSLDWLLMTARFLFLIREEKLISKSEAADWGFLNVKGAWREYLPKAKEIRKNPSMAELPEVKSWLESLTEPIQESCKELERELVAQG